MTCKGVGLARGHQSTRPATGCRYPGRKAGGDLCRFSGARRRRNAARQPPQQHNGDVRGRRTSPPTEGLENPPRRHGRRKRRRANRKHFGAPPSRHPVCHTTPWIGSREMSRIRIGIAQASAVGGITAACVRGRRRPGIATTLARRARPLRDAEPAQPPAKTPDDARRVRIDIGSELRSRSHSPRESSCPV